MPVRSAAFARRHPRARRVLFVLLALCAIEGAAAAQSGDALTARLDAIAGAGVRENRSVGVAAAVVKGGDTLLLRAYGKAVVDPEAPATVDTVFAIGSDTKQFTAAAILKLRDAGRLGVDDPITRWLPDFDTHGHTITLRHLLGHTSGIAELIEMPELRAMRLMVNPTATREDVYKVVNRTPLMFPTGTMEAYSNTNFWLLGLVIEKASGVSYEEYIEQTFFAPLGMTRSMYCNAAEDVPRRARGHGLRNGVARRAPDIVHTGTFASGALCSTVEDLVTWLEALHGGKVLTRRSYTEMIAPATLADGTRLRYGMGLFVGEDRHGLSFIGHDGGGFGFSSNTRWYPAARLAVVALTNSEPDDMTAVTDALVAAVIPPPAVRSFAGDASLLVGTYRGRGRNKEMVVEVAQTPGGLTFTIDGAAGAPLPWVDAWTFRQGQTLLILRRKGTVGPATELRVDRGGGHFVLTRQ